MGISRRLSKVLAKDKALNREFVLVQTIIDRIGKMKDNQTIMFLITEFETAIQINLQKIINSITMKN